MKITVKTSVKGEDPIVVIVDPNITLFDLIKTINQNRCSSLKPLQSYWIYSTRWDAEHDPHRKYLKQQELGKMLCECWDGENDPILKAEDYYPNSSFDLSPKYLKTYEHALMVEEEKNVSQKTLKASLNTLFVRHELTRTYSKDIGAVIADYVGVSVPTYVEFEEQALNYLLENIKTFKLDNFSFFERTSNFFFSRFFNQMQTLTQMIEGAKFSKTNFECATKEILIKLLGITEPELKEKTVAELESNFLSHFRLQQHLTAKKLTTPKK